MTARSYRFHPLERRGLVVGLEPVQLATLAAGIAAALGVLSIAGPVTGLPVAGAILAAAGVAACWPVAGRPPVAWLPLVIRRAVERRVALGHPDPGTVPAGLSLVELAGGPGDGPLGAVADRASGTWAAVLPLGGRAFTLLDPEDKERRLASWRSVLAATGRPGSPVHRIQWIERTTAPDAEPLHRYLAESGAGDPAGAPRRSYDGLLARAGEVGEAHSVALVVAVRPRRAARSRRAAARRHDGAGALLRREVRILQGQLRTADVTVGAPLDLPGLATAVRAGVEPVASPARSRSTRGAWPMAVAEDWSMVRVDGRWQVSYWIAEWPRVDVGPDFLVPLLLTAGVRAVSLTMAPVPSARAIREVESARTADAADDELRRRAGFLATARHRRQAEGVAEREAELAEGHAELRFSGYVAVSADSTDELDRRCTEVEHAAQQCHLELRRLYGQQREALAWTLPLARGVAG